LTSGIIRGVEFFDVNAHLTSPRALADLRAVEARRQQLDAAHIRPLVDWAADISARAPTGATQLVPLPDPADGGTNARALFVLEAPGPATYVAHGSVDAGLAPKRTGSGFISIDNNDATAAAMWRARHEARLAHGLALHWNIVPWYLGPATKKPTSALRQAGADALRELVEQLPSLEVIVYCGVHATTAANRWLGDLGYQTLFSVHPSPLALAREGRRELLHDRVREAAEIIGVQ